MGFSFILSTYVYKLSRCRFHWTVAIQRSGTLRSSVDFVSLLYYDRMEKGLLRNRFDFTSETCHFLVGRPGSSEPGCLLAAQLESFFVVLYRSISDLCWLAEPRGEFFPEISSRFVSKVVTGLHHICCRFAFCCACA